MDVAFLADRSDIHTVRWVNGLSERGYNISLLTMHDGGGPLPDGVSIHHLPFSAPHGYYLNAPFLRAILNRINPDLLHTHFASGYGTLARLGGTHPLLLSVWGSDVYRFPGRSPLHRRVIVKNLSVADHLCSTSFDMARQTKSLGDSTDWSISITPFGIDTDTFCPNGRNRRDVVKGGGKDRIVVGTVKKLEPKYGVDVLISSFARLRECLADEKPEVADSLRLLIVGDGPQRTELEAFVRDRGLGPVTTFVGAVPHAEVPSYLRTLDVYVAASRSESFGVAVVEASACGRPAVVTNVGGLPEVVRHGETGAVVPCEDPEATATALRRLVLDSELRASMGKVGRRYAIETYEWSACLDRMEKIYQDLVENEGKSLPLQ